MNKRTYGGLDVHSRSVKGCAIDRETRETVESPAGVRLMKALRGRTR
ncbi:hypothetical protein [Arthrobacter sp. ok362]|jgi:hypothetical protein|nr:hypothetical protein [Arthrobacter sp. ok362]SDL86292.1 hypothetical protein SAMN04487913_11640 [Arthrobacter sp. ok362]